MKFSKNQNIILRKVHGSFFLVNISDHYDRDRCILFELNHIGAFIWNSLDVPKSIEEVSIILQRELADPVELSVLENDVEQFVSELRKLRFLEEEANG